MLTKHYTAWIDVDDLLPHEDSLYLVAYEHDYQDGIGVNVAGFSVDDSTFYDSRQCFMNNTENDGLVTHWMALPSPPQPPAVNHGKCKVCSANIYRESGAKWQHRGGQSFWVNSVPEHRPRPRDEQE